MIQSKLAALLLATATVGAGPVLFAPSTAQAQAEAEVSFEFFHDSLSPYGEWIEVGDYGLCWRPSEVDAEWAPYTDGYWSYTDAGWTWVSYEDFGGITYHYGRWVNVEDEGWCWVPDYEWGPAWVSWRNSEEHVGWAPLPPEARWEPTVGFSVWVDNSYDIGPSYYNFCAVEDFGAPVIREVILPRPRNVVIIENTVNITNITVNNFIGVPFCGGPRYDLLIGRVRRPIPALKLVRETNITNIYNNTVINKTVIRNGNRRGRAIHAVQQGNQLIVPAPRVKRVANTLAALPHIKPARSVPTSKVRKGWNLVQDEGQRDRIKKKFAQDAKGLRPETAPARPMQTAELKPVPEKADPNAPSPVRTGGRGNRNGNGRNERDDQPGRPEKPERTAQAGQPEGSAPQPNVQADNNGPGKPGRDKERKERGENAGVAAGERSPLRPFNGGKASDGPGREKERRQERDAVAETDRPAAPVAASEETKAGTEDAQKEKARKEKEQIARAAEVQEEFRKRQREQKQPGRVEKNQDNEGEQADRQKAGERAERNREAAQAAAAEARREQQARAAEKEAAREQAAAARAERQREAAMEERQRGGGEARRQQQEALERRQQRMQSEAVERRAQQPRDGAAEQRRQQAQAAAAAQARRAQMESMQRQQAVRQQQAEAIQQQRAQAMRQQQMQAQRQMQAQQFQQAQRQQMQRPQAARGDGGGDGERRGGRGRRGEKEE